MKPLGRVGHATPLLLVLLPSPVLADMGGITEASAAAFKFIAAFTVAAYVVVHLLYGAAAWSVARRWQLGHPVRPWLAVLTAALLIATGVPFVAYEGSALWMLALASLDACREWVSPTMTTAWVSGPDGAMIAKQIPTDISGSLSLIGMMLAVLLVGALAFGVPSFWLWRGWRQRAGNPLASASVPPAESIDQAVATPVAGDHRAETTES
jgi:hypothetical protein